MNLFRKITAFCCLLVLLTSIHTRAFGQINTYQEANRFFEQQNFGEALPLFEELLQNNPRSLVFFERTIDSLIGLRKIDEAMTVAVYHAGGEAFALQASVKLSELYHLSGEPGTAIERWIEEAEANILNIQAIYYIGNSASERGEFETAIQIYERANEAAGDDTLFLSEIANNYMLSGNFEKSVEVYFRLITESPEQMPYVQQRFLRMRDVNLFEIASFELEEVLLDLDYSHPAYNQMYQLLVWLLLETEEYNRAYHVARQFENNTPYDIYSLLTLGGQLRSAHQYELAVQSYEYYTETPGSSLFPRALEELGNTHREWALHVSQNQILDYRNIQEITDAAYRYYEELITGFPEYQRLDLALTSIIDLSLDSFKSADQAKDWFHKLQTLDRSDNSAFIHYTEGRIALFNQNFTSARQLLTRADRASDDSNLSEKARYYISLSDVFAGDYEFAEIQLRSLEQRSTSFYANEAIKMRMWINNGLRADSSGSHLAVVGRGLHALHVGKYGDAFEELNQVISDPSNPLGDDMIVELKKSAPPEYYPVLFRHLQDVIEQQPGSPLRERLIWDAISLAIYFSEHKPETDSNPAEFSAISPADPADSYIESYAEKMLMEFPDGFYTPYIREILRNRPEITI